MRIFLFALLCVSIFSLPCPSLPQTLAGYSVDCSFLTVPLDFGHPAARQINVSMTILSTTTLPVKRIVLILNGGPGGSGIELTQQMASAVPIAFAEQAGLLLVLPGRRSFFFFFFLFFQKTNSFFCF
jgi:hypothetical protein